MEKNNCTGVITTLLIYFVAFLVPVHHILAQSDAEPSQRPEPTDFLRDIRPIFAEHCHACHGAQRQESNFRLDVKSQALASADFGDPPIVPGDSAASPLFQYISQSDADVQMPPADRDDRLNKAQVNLIGRWIDEGANWPEEAAGDAALQLTTDHWSFQPMIDVPLPDPKTVWPNFEIRNGIDRFIAQELDRNDLQPSPTADPATLIRRLYLDLHGLLPNPNQVQAFVDNDSNQAYEELVDELLASQHYGERWARHWLDVVRFGESTGYEVNRDRANAYYYRDYVIDALNTDKPYRDFIIEQIAGDAVGVDEATGFLVGGPNDIVKSPDINLTLAQREDELADYVNTTSTTFLGLTVACARCHNHKFDPILQKDYYALQAFFAGVQHGERPLTSRIPDEDRKSLETARKTLNDDENSLVSMRNSAPAAKPAEPNRLPMVNAKLNSDPFDLVEARFVRFAISQTNQAEPCLDELEVFSAENVNVALASSGGVATSSGNYANDPKHQLQHINDGKFGNEFSWIANTETDAWIQIELPQLSKINRVDWARDRAGKYADRLAIDYQISVSRDGNEWQAVSNSARRIPYSADGKEAEDAFVARLPERAAHQARQLLVEIKQLRDTISELEKSIPIGYVGTFQVPPKIHRLYRGDPLAPREEVGPDVLTVMGSLDIEGEISEQDRRLKLAQWIASEQNPLTARVIVNRVWHYHFGTGIVSTPSDLGVNGTRPSHPELLDWLSQGFIDHGWSLKWLHRQILMSSTYRQSSQPRADAIAKDAQSRLLWRFPPRRLEAEAIRDCVLQVSGKLNLQAGGPGFLLFKIDRENVHHYFPLEKFEPEHFRRMIYMTKIRQEQDEVFGVFDCPDGGQTIPSRSRSTTALQALNLLNSQFMLEQAQYLAERLKQTAGDRPEDQIRLAFELAFLRSPTEAELGDALDLVQEHGMESFCRALLNANELLFLS